ncbi:MAG TPA: glycoside hydrolase family 88 protein [Bacteroidales bacterium]|nr:glycoside hydrolase family 88 protein [Bacteroidales bacterium]HPJ58284.1 glycoside hydrolase family 88 protein [Bacteroidales bacterium]HPR10910.1 glycoside hydrolase family 88 protein [Bacteroidales bacterium]HRW84130.1 glycoside hydrolase family 88 protein [Bacteroidales bacterium]
MVKKKLFPVPVALLVLVMLAVAACNSGKPSAKKAEEKWSVRMANTVMAQADSLTKYVAGPPKWAYDVAFLGMAIDRLGDIDPKYSGYMENWIDYFVQPDGSVINYRLDEYNLDRIYPGRNILTIYKRKPEERYKIAMDNLIEQLKTHPKTNSGGYWHKKIYPWQMWLDGIYMASTYMVQYAKEFNAPGWYDVAANQAKMVYGKTLDPSSGLLMHAWDESREQRWCNPETGQSQYPWSRAMGWYAMALTDILDYLPPDHSDRDTLINILQNVSKALLEVRDPESGIWYQVLNQGGREGNYLEGSGSAMYIYVFAKAARLGYLDQKYRDIASDALDDFIRELVTVDEKGMVTIRNICGGCGLGGNPYRDGSYEYYINEKRFENDTKGVAPFILAAIELDR